MRRPSAGRLLLLTFLCTCARHVASQTTGPKNSSSLAPTGMVFAALVRNLTVSTMVFHNGSKILQLHISWQLPTDGRRPTRLILHVVPSNYSGCPQEPQYCPDGYIYEVIEDTRMTSISVPRNPSYDHFRITPDCCYEVKMESSPHNGKTFATKNFTAPGISVARSSRRNTLASDELKFYSECTEDVCSCRKSRLPVPSITSVAPQGSGSVKVTWVVESTVDVSRNIAKFAVRLGEEADIRSRANLAVFNTSLLREVSGQEHSTVLEAVFRKDRDYRLEVAAEDNRRCRGQPAEHTFHGGSLMENTKKENKNTPVLVVLLVVSMLAAVVCLVAVLTRTRWFASLRTKIGGGRGRPPDAYKPVSVNSDITRFSDVIKSALHERNILYVEAEIEEARQRGVADEYEMSEARLRYVKEVGKGAFGHVFMAQAECLAGVPGPLAVAVKKLRPQASEDEAEQFLAEIAMMKRVGRHANVVAMLGCCTLARPYCMVMEFVPCGDLLRYLHVLRAQYQRTARLRPKYLDLMLSSSDSGSSYIFPGEKSDSSATTSVFTSPAKTNSCSSMPKSQWSLPSSTPDITADVPVHGTSHVECVLDCRELQNFALEVARGMAYLEQKQITHRDLAARNVLIDENKTLKISDFGLSRSGIYVNMRHKKVPLRWLSIEAIQDNLYSSKSDVWAFAVLLWEMGTLGAFPYPTVGDYRLLPYLLEGKRLEKPDNCTKELYSLMMQCWSQRVDERPSFADLVSSLESMTSRRHAYVDFGALQKDYTFPPTEDELKSR